MTNLRVGVLSAFLAFAWAATSWADTVPGFHRIVTGTAAGTYFPVGSLIANAISAPAGSRSCEAGGSCGVPGLIAVATTSAGSIANIEALAAGAADSALVQADVAFWAFSGRSGFAGGAMAHLRAIAALYGETVHVVVRRDAGIAGIADLAGRRVSVGPLESGTRAEALLVLEAYGLAPADLVALDLSPAAASDALGAGKLDAFFVVAGHPVPAVRTLAQSIEIDVLAIDGPAATELVRGNPFFRVSVLPAETYPGVPERVSLGVNALWVTTADADDKLVYEMTRALWHPRSRALFDGGHPRAKEIVLDSALDGVSVPLHEGALRYYREIGRLPENEG